MIFLKQSIITFLLTISVLVANKGVNGQIVDAATPPTSSSATIASNLANIPQTSLLSAVLNGTSFSSVAHALSQPGNYTVFAPSNTAFNVFKNFGANPYDARNLTGSIPAQAIYYLQNALQYHVIPSRIMSSEISNGDTFAASLLTDPYFVQLGQNLSQRIHINKANNSVNIIMDASYNSAYETHVVIADIVSSNGVIHVIDQILTVPDDFSNTAERINAYNFLTAVNAAGLLNTLQSTPNITIFVPENRALSSEFELVGGNTSSQLVASTLSSVVQSHVVRGTYYSTNITGKSLTTLYNQTLSLGTSNGGLTVGGATVIAADILIGNGVIHVINQKASTVSAA